MNLIKEFENNEKRYLKVSNMFLFMTIGLFFFLVYELINATIKLIKFNINIFDLTVFPFVTLFLCAVTLGIICELQSENYRDKIKILKAIKKD